MLKKLEVGIKEEEKRLKLEELLDSFTFLERKDLISRLPSFARYIDDISGKDTANSLLYILSSSLPEINSLSLIFEDPEVQDWVQRINAKYTADFEGIFPPIAHDWYRINWSTKVDFTHGNLPLIGLEILKRNGEVAYLEMPFDASIKLINFVLRQISVGKKQMGDNIKPIISEEIKNTQKLVDEILKD